MEALPETIPHNYNQQQIPNNLILLMLGYDELYLIFKLLDVVELIEVEKVCQRFQKIAQEVYKSHKVLDLYCLNRYHGNSKVKQVAQEITLRVGPYVEKLSGFGFFKLLRTKYFTNLKEFNIEHMHRESQTEKSKRKVRTLLRPLKKVKFSPYLIERKNTTDEDLIDFLDIPQLEELQIPEFNYIKGSFFDELANITVLSLVNCQGIEAQYFYQFCNKKPKLRSLNIIACNWIDTMCLQSIVANLQNLEKLHLSFNYKFVSNQDYFALAQLTKLKQLKINLWSYTYITTISLDILYRCLYEIFKKNKLESFSINGGDDERDYEDESDEEEIKFTEEIKAAIKCLTHIKRLKLDANCFWEDTHLNHLPCENTLENLILNCMDRNTNITTHGISQLIARCSSIKFIHIIYYDECQIDVTLLIDLILPFLKNRPHMLELKMYVEHKKHFPKEKFGMYYGINSSRLMLSFD